MSEQRADLLSPEEVERWADTLTSEMCDLNSPIRNALLRGLDEPSLAHAIASKIVLPGLELPLDPAIAAGWRELIASGNSDKIREIFKKVLRESPRAYFEFLRKLADKAQSRKALLALANKLKGKQGRAVKLAPDHYKHLAERADSLYPVLLYILRERERGTNHTIQELLEFLSVDYSSQVAYLQKHIDRLDEALRNPKIPQECEKIETRARLLAAGLAGCEEKYAFSSSVERVRQVWRRK